MTTLTTKTLVITAALLIYSANATAFFCPKNFTQVAIGDSIDKVRRQCPPDQEETKEIGPPVPQEWTYLISQQVMAPTGTLSPGTLKTTVTFDKSGQAVNISVNGIGVGESTICGGNGIQLGNTLEQIKNACGEPSFINKQSTDTNTAPPAKITVFIYNKMPPVKINFQDGSVISTE